MVYIIGQTRKHERKDGSIVEYGPYFWLVENRWTPHGPRVKKLQYLRKYPPSDLLEQYGCAKCGNTMIIDKTTGHLFCMQCTEQVLTHILTKHRDPELPAEV